MLGEDRSAEFTKEKIMNAAVVYRPEARKAYQESVAKVRAEIAAAKRAEMSSLAGEESDLAILIAVASKGGGRINEHFGHAREFQVYEASARGVHFVGHRRVDQYCQGGFGEEESLEVVARAIADCVAVLVARIGACPRKGLEAAGIEVVDRYAHEPVEASAIAYLKDYLRRVREGKISPAERGDAAIRQGALTHANGNRERP
jgi:nitrogen fixation protein NifB